MPFRDMPLRRERSAPVLDLTNPSEIWRYFDDLESLFLKHSVSDNQEKKQAAVNYLSVAEERVWKTADAFDDPSRSYKDFKAEVIALYPEAEVALQHSLADLEKLSANQACTLISSKLEFGKYYQRFMVVSHSLISKGRISAQDQA